MSIGYAEPAAGGSAAPLASILLIAPHPDDALTGAGGWICGRAAAIHVAFLTEGVPRNARFFSDRTRDPERYRRRRRREALAAWRRHRPEARLYFGHAVDQELAFSLSESAAWLQEILDRARPALILVPAFEGGHPDHDAANCLVARLAGAAGAPVLEYALYTWRQGAMVRQRFPEAPRFTRPLGSVSLARKRASLACYRSQHSVLRDFSAGVESIRPLAAHDYRRRPCPGATVYETWGWPHPAEAVAEALDAWQRGWRPAALPQALCAS